MMAPLLLGSSSEINAGCDGCVVTVRPTHLLFNQELGTVGVH